jgi:hypothetical protein
VFKWFKNKKKKEKEIIVVINKGNYKIRENDDIVIRVKSYHHLLGILSDDIIVPKSSIVSHTENNIVFKDYNDYYNFQSSYMGYVLGGDAYKSIEEKENYIKYKETQLKTYEYFKEEKYWKLINTDIIGTEIVYEKTPLEVFKEIYKSKYKLIETEKEFNDYMKSTFDCNTWCRNKLYNKMKELKLGDGFINQFADLIDNDLNKYHAMIDLANEVTDKDTLMYLYTYKFGK